MRTNFWRAILFVAAAAVAAGCGQTPNDVISPAPAFTQPPVGLQTPGPNSVYLGAYVPTSSGPVSLLESLIGRHLALNSHYNTFGRLFLNDSGDLAAERYSIEAWDCGMSNAQIVAGAADSYLITRALAIKAFGHQLFLRYFWDINTPASTVLPYSGQSRAACYDKATDNPDGTFSATEFIAAWIHIRRIFAEEGTTNVIWVWSVSGTGSSPNAYYPGDSEVDWIGVDSYAGLLDFATVFGGPYALVASHNKPILVTETGALGANQSAFFAAVPTELQLQFPLVKGFTYFDSVNDGVNYTLSPGGTSAFAAMANTPYMSAFGTP
jgi:hypothetical protein